MPVNIPSPLGSPGRKRPNPIETLLLGLAGQAGSLGLQRLISPGIAGAQEKARTDVRVEAAEKAAANVAEIEAAAAKLKAQHRQEAFQRGREVLGNAAAIEVDGVKVDVATQLQAAFDFSFAASEAGEGDSSINLIMKELLPPGAGELLDEQETRLKILSTEDAKEADAFATAYLIRIDVLPDGAPITPGSSKTMLALIASKEGKKINWFQEGLDHITSRVGDSMSGSILISVGGQQQINPNPGGEAVTVEQATAEWRAILERYAPADVVEREMKRLNSAAAQREITKNMAVDAIIELLEAGGDETDIRTSFAGAFTPTVINVLIERARQNTREMVPFPRN